MSLTQGLAQGRERKPRPRTWGVPTEPGIARLMSEDYELARRRDRCSRRDFADGYLAMVRRLKVFCPDALEVLLGGTSLGLEDRSNGLLGIGANDSLTAGAGVR